MSTKGKGQDSLIFIMYTRTSSLHHRHARYYPHPRQPLPTNTFLLSCETVKRKPTSAQVRRRPLPKWVGMKDVDLFVDGPPATYAFWQVCMLHRRSSGMQAAFLAASGGDAAGSEGDTVPRDLASGTSLPQQGAEAERAHKRIGVCYFASAASGWMPTTRSSAFGRAGLDMQAANSCRECQVGTTSCDALRRRTSASPLHARQVRYAAVISLDDQRAR